MLAILDVVSGLNGSSPPSWLSRHEQYISKAFRMDASVRITARITKAHHHPIRIPECLRFKVSWRQRRAPYRLTARAKIRSDRTRATPQTQSSLSTDGNCRRLQSPALAFADVPSLPGRLY